MSAVDPRPDLERPLQHVHDAPLVIVDDVEHADAAERPGVVRLAAGRRIERGLVEDDARAAVLDGLRSTTVAVKSRQLASV